jgi:hypothetical protein
MTLSEDMFAIWRIPLALSLAACAVATSPHAPPETTIPGGPRDTR